MAEVAVSHSEDKPEKTQLDETLIISQAKCGSREAFEVLVRSHQQRVYAITWRMLGNKQEAEDAAQDVFVQAYRALASFRGEAAFSTWLISIAMNVCRNYRRSLARRRRVIACSLDEPKQEDAPDKHDVPDSQPSAAEKIQRKDQHEQILEALQLLDEPHRSVIVLRDIHGYSYEEIASTLECEVGTVKSRLNRARLALRGLLDGKL